MLRITTNDSGDLLTIRLEGRLSGPSLEELEKCWKRSLAARLNGSVVVDLTGVISVDATGKSALKAMHELGAQFITADCLMESIISEVTETAPEGSPVKGDSLSGGSCKKAEVSK